ncbi:hypothetical protein PR048_005422 [Dryococelus australis]|uniref:Uncharacterized protein n=1 Tax=Dryococelus australis TaxID=614101 RepID=A0ABQ9I881_9NEOP|nr:hypothetical protein PR048_005422 [Dryococelus australis]
MHFWCTSPPPSVNLALTTGGKIGTGFDSRTTGSHNKLQKEQEEMVVNEINSFPGFISHYSRASNSYQFIPPETTLHIMYSMCKEEIEEPVSFATYKKIFYSKFNLKHKPLKKDTCNISGSFKAPLSNACTEDLKADIKKRDIILTSLQQSQHLMLYNCGVHPGSNNKGYCYCCIEEEAGRGAQQVGPCLRQHLLEKYPEVQDLTLWKSLKNSTPFQCITQSVLISGHSFLPNDSDFGGNESAHKYQQRIYTAVDYMIIMRSYLKKNPSVSQGNEAAAFCWYIKSGIDDSQQDTRH